MNEGKRFEADWRDSIRNTPGAWYYRFRDSPASYYGGAQEGIRFAADNICDCQVYAWPCLHLFELKTVGTPSAALSSLFGSFDPVRQEYRKAKHLRQMAEAARRPGVTASVVIHYRATGHTWACGPEVVLAFLNAARMGGRKSIPEEWCEQHGIEVAGRQLRVHWRYDVAGLMERLAQGEGHP